MSIQKYFRELTVEVRGLVDDGCSGLVEAWVTDRVINGTIHKASPKAIISASQLKIDMSHVLYSDILTPIRDSNEDESIIKRINDGGVIYDIRSVPENVAERNHHYNTKLRVITSA